MGGYVSETIRKQNGDIIKMCRVTGSYNFMFFSKDFSNDKINEAIDEHVKTYFSLKENHKNKSYLAPEDYGIVVIDFKNKKIHSMQGYDKPSYQHFVNISMLNNSESHEIYDFLFKQNRLAIYTANNDYLAGFNDFFGNDISLSKFHQIIKNEFKIRYNNEDVLLEEDFNKSFFNLTIQPTSLKNFKYIKYEESIDGILSFITNLMNEGFKFTNKEKQMWINFSERYIKNKYDNLSESLLVNKKDNVKLNQYIKENIEVIKKLFNN